MIRTRMITAAALGLASTLAIVPTPSNQAVGQQSAQRERERRQSQQQRSGERTRARFEPAPADAAIQEVALVREPRNLDGEIQNVQDRIRELRLQEIDLRTAVETIEITGSKSTVGPRVALLNVQHELEATVVQLDSLLMERQDRVERLELARMSERLRYVANWRDVAFDPGDAVMLATQAIVELLAGSGEPDTAAKMLEEVLTQVDHLGSRTAVRFALKDVYVETGQHQEAAKQMAQIIIENANEMSPR